MTTTPQVPIRCPEKLKPGGCQLHNLHCGWPKCNEPTKASPVQTAEEGALRERARSLAEHWHEGVPAANVFAWCCQAAGALLSLSAPPEPAAAPAAGEPQEHPVDTAMPSLGLHATEGRAETCADDATRKLAAFGAWAAREFRDSLSDVDGGSAQDAMERLGVIVKRTVTEPCGEGCVCIEYGDFPHECYAFPKHISAAIDAAVSQEPTGSGS